MMKKEKTLILAIFILIYTLTADFSAIKVRAATFNDINNSGVFLKQEGSSTCTLCAAAMMLRRTAMLRGDSNWSSITESALRPVAWSEGNGLKWLFSYSGMTVSHASLSGSEESKKNQLISLLNKHPEGIVLYYSCSRPHAVLLTDYTNGTFYCADPYGKKPYGRIPLSQCLYVTVANANYYWYISSPSVQLGFSEAVLPPSNQANTPPATPAPSINNVGFDSINSDGFTLHCSVDNASLVKINVESLDTHQKLSDSYTSNLQNVSYSFQASSLPSSSRQYTVYIYAYASNGKGGYCNETLHRVMYGPIGNVVVLPIQPMRMYIEEVPMDMVSGGYITGWIVHISEIERIVVEMNGKEYPVTNRYPREDVKAVFPQYDVSKAGFSLQLDPIGLLHGANYLTIKIFVDGAWVDVYHTDFEIVKLSDLYFDDAYYYARYKQEDEEVRRIGPNRDELLRYYYRNGVTKGHAPCMGWDPKAYLSLNKDLQKAYGSDYREAYAHFVRYCLPMDEMRILSPYLDLKYYKENYEVLSSMNAAELFSHYVLYGSKAGWQASASQEAGAFHKLYSPEQYAQRNADIQKVLGNDSNQLWRHFWTYTIANGEKRVTSDNFDFDYVIRTYGLSNSSEAFWWYLNTGYAMDVLTKPHALKKSEAVAATCEKAGHLAYYACTECGKVFRDAAGTNETTLADLVTQAVGHTYNAWTIVKEASAAEDGIRQRQCLICGRVETETIPKTGIQSSDEETEKSKELQEEAGSDEVSEGSNTEKGSEEGEDSERDSEKETEIPEQDSDGEIEEPDQDIESDNPESMPSAPLAGTQLEDSKSNAIYIVTKSGMNGALEYLSPKNKKAASITIPASVVIDGITYKVTSIGKNAFKNNKSVTRVSIGKNVDAIGKNAFYKCKSLKTITIKTTKLTSKSVKSNAFKGISSKAVFKVPKKSVATYKRIIKSRGAGSKVRVRTQ